MLYNTDNQCVMFVLVCCLKKYFKTYQSVDNQLCKRLLFPDAEYIFNAHFTLCMLLIHSAL